MRRPKAVIRRALAIGRGRLPFLFALAALIFVPLGLFDAAEAEISALDFDQLDDLQFLGAVASGALHAATSLLGGVLYAGAVSIVVIETPPGEHPSPGRLLREIRWGALIAIDLLFALGMFFSLLLLIIPGLIFFARYALTAVVAEIEERTVRDAFRRCHELAKGSYRLVLGVLFAASILGDAINEGAKAVAAAVGADSFLATWLSSSATEILYGPVLGLLSVALVFELGARPRPGAPGLRTDVTGEPGPGAH